MTSLLEAAALARCRLFGAFSIENRKGAIRLRSRRARALIAFLVLAGPQGARRERMSGLLWSDRGEEQARASLRQCLLELRRELAEAGVDLLETGRDHVAIRPGALATDVGELEAAVNAQDTAALANQLRTIGANRLLEDLSVGGLFDDWLSRTRAQLDSTIEREIYRAIEAAEGAGAWEDLREIAASFLLRSPTDEVVAAAAIRADMALGVTSAAHRRFRALESTLAHEYGLRPGSAVSRALSATAGASAPQAEGQAARPAAPASHPATVDASPPIVVVSAFEDADANEATKALADIVRDEVVSGLSRFRDLSVLVDPQPASSLDRGAFADPQLVFTLGARMSRGARPGMIAQLVRLHTRDIVWSDTFDIPEAGILAATDMIVARVVGAVLPSIDLHLMRPQRQGDNGSSYLRYLRANRLALTAATHAEAREAAADLEEQIRTHPRFVLPYLPLASLYNTDFNYTLAGSSDAATREKALELAKKAISIDRRHVHGYVVAGWSYLRSRRWEPALQLFEQALSLNPFNASRLKEIGFGLLFLDQRDRARELLNRCLLVNPTPEDTYFADLGLLELICGNGERAATYFDLVANPSLWSTVHQAVNAELSEQGAAPLSKRARERIASIWPQDRDWTPEAVLAWIGVHHPFRSPEVEARFMAGAGMMLGQVSAQPTPA